MAMGNLCLATMNPNKLALVCKEIIFSEQPIEAYFFPYKPTQANDAGRMLCCYFCHCKLTEGKVDLAEFYKGFMPLPEELVRQKILNYE